MDGWKKRLLKTAAGAEDQFDRMRLKLTERLRLADPLIIEPYIGYGTPHAVMIKGRVLQNKSIQAATDQDTVWRNLLNAYRRLESDEVPGATVQGEFYGRSETAVTDKEGYFNLTFTLSQPLPPQEPWHEATLTLLDAPLEFEAVRQNGRVLVPPASADYGVISDIDDTILQSSATNYLHAARLLLLQNARTRLPFAGVAAFYQALQQGVNGRSRHNPIFYVSSSPWNVFTLLADFFEHQQIPPGPLFLKDYGLSAGQFLSSGHRTHKLAQIDELLSTYPHLPFVLIGDSGQKDPEIYAEVVQRYPGRIKAIYIRDVTAARRDREVLALAKQVKAAGVDMLLTADSLAAATHAAEKGLIDPAALPAITASQLAEEKEAVPLDEMGS